MNEQEIVSQGDVSNPVEDKLPEGTLTADIDLKSKIDLFTHLDIPFEKLSDDETSSLVKDIYEWGKISGVGPDQMIITINQISSRIGHTPDKSQLQNVWEWCRLDVERRKIESKMKSMESINGS